MIFTLIGADFSKSNIGTLSNWIISRELGAGATYTGPSFVEKNATFSATVTLSEGYEIGSAGITITMGGTPLDESYYSVVDNIITFTIVSVIGGVVIKVPTKNTNTGEEDVIPNYIFTINPNPTSATVTLSATDYSDVSGSGSQSITVADGTVVNWSVSADGYTKQTGTWTISGGNKIENITLTAKSGPDTYTYNNSGYVAAATGKVVAGGTWIHSDFIPVAQLANGDDGKCVRTFTGHGTVAAIAFYTTKDNFDSWVSSVKTGDIEGGATSVTAEYVKSLAPAGSNYVVFSTDGSKQTLSVTVGNSSGGGSSEPEEPDTPVTSGVNYYDKPGFISISSGQVTNTNSDWIHSDFIAIDSLVDDAQLGHCIGKCTGHASVADIAFYSAPDFSSFIVGKSSAGATKTVAALQTLMTELNATNATHIIISTDKTKNQLYASLK